jgi:hypothetical protein
MGLSIEEVAERAGVDVGYVGQLVDIGAVALEKDGFGERDAHVVALLSAWEGRVSGQTRSSRRSRTER